MLGLDNPAPGTLGYALIQRSEAMTRESVAMMVHAGRTTRASLAADLERRRRDMAAQDRRLAAIQMYRWE